MFVAIADFGIGITQSVKNYNKSISTDTETIKWALQDHSTVQSTTHNKGLGMGNILAIASTARIVSGNGLLLKRDKSEKFITINFKFPGTLIYMDVDMSTFDDVEILETFNW